MRGEIPMRNGDEADAFTRWRRWLSWAPGRLREIKRGYRRRARRAARREITDSMPPSPRALGG